MGIKMAEVEKLQTLMSVVELSNKVKELQYAIDSNFLIEEAVSYTLMCIRHNAKAGLRKLVVAGPNKVWNLPHRGISSITLTVPVDLVNKAIEKIKENGFEVNIVGEIYEITW
jgi:hypothetical protein